MKQGNSKSIKAVLLNLAKQENVQFQQIVTRFLHERLLYRVSISEYKSNFVLKGGNLIYAIEGLQIRPTTDIDMLAKNINNDQENIKQIFKNICDIKYKDDCVIFNSKTITTSEIAEENKYSGVRLLIDTQFDTIRQAIQIDIGFGDIITPDAVSLSFPVLLKELNAPEILAYSIETVIAEKFHAMITLGNANSRMKDLFDAYILLKNNEIEDLYLTNAIVATFKERKVVYEEKPAFFTESYSNNENRIVMWKAFLRKIKYPENLDFSAVVKNIIERLYPVYCESKDKI